MELAELTERVQAFVESKGWYAPHSAHPQTLTNLAKSLCIESAEVLELFQWSEQCSPEVLGAELADVLFYLLQLADLAGVDLGEAALNKLEKNRERRW